MAALPSWLRVKRQHSLPAAIVVEFDVDTSEFTKVMRAASAASLDAARAMRRLGRAIQASATDLQDILDLNVQPVWGATEARHPANQWLANHQARKRNALEVRLAGLEARWYVRGGLDPQYASEAARDAQVKALMTTSAMGAIRAERLAVAFLRGWAEHHDLTEPRPILAHHHRWGSQVVQVVAA